MRASPMPRGGGASGVRRRVCLLFSELSCWKIAKSKWHQQSLSSHRMPVDKSGKILGFSSSSLATLAGDSINMPAIKTTTCITHRPVSEHLYNNTATASFQWHRNTSLVQSYAVGVGSGCHGNSTPARLHAPMRCVCPPQTTSCSIG